MGYSNRRFCIFTIYAVLICGFFQLFAQETDPSVSQAEEGEISEKSFLPYDFLSIDTLASARGGGSVRTAFSQFSMNPSAGMLTKHYSMGVLYLNPDTFSLSVYDSKTQGVGGGLMYRHSASNDELKLNVAFNLGSYFSAGVNVKRFTGDWFRYGADLLSYNLDFGFAIRFAGNIMLGAGFTDIIAIDGDDLPKKINVILETALLGQSLGINAGFNWHWDHDEELFENERDKFHHMDIFAGMDYTLKYFTFSVGINNRAFEEELTFESSLKSAGVSFYYPGSGGVHTAFLFKEDEFTFSVQLVFEPM